VVFDRLHKGPQRSEVAYKDHSGQRHRPVARSQHSTQVAQREGWDRAGECKTSPGKGTSRKGWRKPAVPGKDSGKAFEMGADGTLAWVQESFEEARGRGHGSGTESGFLWLVGVVSSVRFPSVGLRVAFWSWTYQGKV